MAGRGRAKMTDAEKKAAAKKRKAQSAAIEQIVTLIRDNGLLSGWNLLKALTADELAALESNIKDLKRAGAKKRVKDLEKQLAAARALL